MIGIGDRSPGAENGKQGRRLIHLLSGLPDGNGNTLARAAHRDWAGDHIDEERICREGDGDNGACAYRPHLRRQRRIEATKEEEEHLRLESNLGCSGLDCVGWLNFDQNR
jgi:hypothetical protein